MPPKRVTRSRGSLRGKPTLGKFRGLGHLYASPTSNNLSSSLRTLAPKAQRVHPRVIDKQCAIQITDLSKLEIITSHGQPPTVPTMHMHKHPTTLLTEYPSGWMNNSNNLLSISSIGEMNPKEPSDFENERGGKRETHAIQLPIQQPLESPTPTEFGRYNNRAVHMHQPDYARNRDTHPESDSIQWQHPATPHDSHSGQVAHQIQPSGCAQCPSIWCFHFESIILLDPGQGDDAGISTLMRSYRSLRHHINEAHLRGSRVACALCEDLFCYHLANLALLEGGMGEVQSLRLDLGNSFMTLRTHIREAHGGS